MKRSTLKLIAFLTGALALLIWSGVCFGQIYPVQDCCQQAIRLNEQLNAMTTKYNNASQLLEKTRQTGDQMRDEKNDRIESIKAQANTKLGVANQQTSSERSARIKSDSLLNLARSGLREEFLRSRPFGFGRKKAINELLKKLN